ncbi:MAG: hypothetical protein AAF587_34085 [Bacteroidota bacterium]
MKVAFASLIFLLLSLYAHGDSYVCDPEISLQEQIDQADIIFSGTCIFVNTNWVAGGHKFVFKVDQSWKRRIDSLYIVNSKHETNAGFAFEKDQAYLVYVDKGFTPKTNICMGNKLLEQAEEDLQLLGPGRPPGKSSMIGPMMIGVSLLALFSFVFLGVVVLRKQKKPS